MAVSLFNIWRFPYLTGIKLNTWSGSGSGADYEDISACAHQHVWIVGHGHPVLRDYGLAVLALSARHRHCDYRGVGGLWHLGAIGPVGRLRGRAVRTPLNPAVAPVGHFPIQKLPKIWPSKSSLVISPVTSLKARCANRRSSANSSNA